MTSARRLAHFDNRSGIPRSAYATKLASDKARAMVAKNHFLWPDSCVTGGDGSPAAALLEPGQEGCVIRETSANGRRVIVHVAPMVVNARGDHIAQDLLPVP